MPATAAMRGLLTAANVSAINRMYPRKNHIPDVVATRAAHCQPIAANPSVMTTRNSERTMVPP